MTQLPARGAGDGHGLVRKELSWFASAQPASVLVETAATHSALP